MKFQCVVSEKPNECSVSVAMSPKPRAFVSELWCQLMAKTSSESWDIPWILRFRDLFSVPNKILWNHMLFSNMLYVSHSWKLKLRINIKNFLLISIIFNGFCSQELWMNRALNYCFSTLWWLGIWFWWQKWDLILVLIPSSLFHWNLLICYLK